MMMRVWSSSRSIRDDSSSSSEDLTNPLSSPKSSMSIFISCGVGSMTDTQQPFSASSI